MEELRQILLDHAARYPAMEPTDAVKLLYQNEFGGGHLITDAQACLKYLRQEYAGVTPDAACPLAEPIGNGIVRVNLAAVESPEQLQRLGSAFIRSASTHRGSLPAFLEKLELLRALTAQGRLPFDTATLEAYLTGYIAAGCPAVSHSGTYRQLYHPAYRVIRSELLREL